MLPASIRDITPQWLSQALSERSPGTRVRQVDVVSTLHGSATKLELRVAYSAPTDLPRSFYLKGGFEEHGHEVGAAYANEARFYGEWLERLPPIEVPRCYYAGSDLARGQGIVLLENLAQRGCTFGRADHPLSVEQARDVLSVLGAVHGTSWGKTEGLAVVHSPAQHVHPFYRAMIEKFLPEGLAHPEIGEKVPRKLQDADFFSAKLIELWTTRSPVTCAVHGDAHVGNTYLTPARAAGLLDFQTFGAGNWAREFTYFAVGSISVDDRRAHLEDLLDHYLAELVRHGARAPAPDEAMHRVRCNLVHGLFSWVACPLNLQPLEIVKPQADRMAIACEELGALEAYG